MASLRVGSPPYLVNRPLDCELSCQPGFQLFHEHPARLVESLRRAELDVALVSSIELFRMPGYRYLPGAAILGRGGVSSVQVFLRRPLELVRRVVLDPASRAAAVLARIELAERLGRDRVRFEEPELDSDPSEVANRHDACAWLAIGDRALRAKLGKSPPPSFDPAASWVERCKLPFPFAVWIVGPHVELTRDHVAALLAARDRGRARLRELAREASRSWGLDEQACLRYLCEECGFAPGAELARALRRLRDEAAAIGLARADLEPVALEVPIEDVAAPHR